MKYELSYVVEIQFLGFRFHGWQKQTNAKTIHEMVDKTLSFVFKHQNFKTIGVGRTDSKVSANKYLLQLFIDESIDQAPFLKSFNSNGPSDIKGLSFYKVPINFNIIQASKLKEYHYYFSFGTKNHPFAAPFIVDIECDLNIDIMKEGARIFEGEHNFHKYCTKPSAQTIFKRTIISCEIKENTIFTASFFPEMSYVLIVKGEGFLRYQIRLIMGMLIELGKNQVDLNYIRKSLDENNDGEPLKNIAPSSGLQLYNIELIHKKG